MKALSIQQARKRTKKPVARRPRLDGVTMLYSAGGVTRSYCLPDDIVTGINEACPDADNRILAYPSVVIAMLAGIIEEVRRGRWAIVKKGEEET